MTENLRHYCGKRLILDLIANCWMFRLSFWKDHELQLYHEVYEEAFKHLKNGDKDSRGFGDVYDMNKHNIIFFFVKFLFLIKFFHISRYILPITQMIDKIDMMIASYFKYAAR